MAIIWTKLIPRWGGDTIEPPEAKKDTGYIAGDKPPAKWENWLRKGTYEALDETRDVIEDIDSQLAQNVSNVNAHKAESVSYSTRVTRDISLSGEQIIALISGRTPKKVTIFANIDSQPFASWGIRSQNGQSGISQIESGNMASIVNGLVYIRTSLGNQNFASCSIEQGQIKLNWIKTGSPTGTLQMAIVAEYHD